MTILKSMILINNNYILSKQIIVTYMYIFITNNIYIRIKKIIISNF